MSTRYRRSEEQLVRARNVIPLGAQTFSKSFTQYPEGVSPFFAESALGSRLHDIDGNEYIDFVNALASITLGYGDADVNAAVSAQLSKGTIFSLSHGLESDVAELICELVPSAEMVRFGKNGSDATAGAVRVARAFTGKDHILVCGYHGWQDWYIAATARNKGVPSPVRELVHTFPYNDLPALQQKLDELRDKVAAVVLEPMNVVEPANGFLEGVKAATKKANALLVFDETITGFRFANGGAQELFGVTPDLTCLGKGIANGFPLSAVCGRREVMKEMEEIFFSFTMGGETLSLAAAKTVLDKLKREPIVQRIKATGEYLSASVKSLILSRGLTEYLQLSGHPSWTFLTFKDATGATSWEIKTLWMQEILKRGILSLGTHNLSFAHTIKDIDRLVEVYDEVFEILRDAIARGNVRRLLECEPLQPLFRVR
jgi:glutamate-1-semialdehyde 2,1-aminomutase